MSLPPLPRFEPDNKHNIEALYDYIAKLQLVFANAAGEAIDPSDGFGGDSSLTIVDSPTEITYSPGSGLSIDNVLFGHIDIAFVKPARAIGVLICYRELGVTNFKTSFADSSPWRLPNLKVGQDYELALKGIAANGYVGPGSVVTQVTIPVVELETNTPENFSITATYESNVLTWDLPTQGILLEFQVQVADDVDFTTNVELYTVDVNYFIHDVGAAGVAKYYRVRAVSSAGDMSDWTSGVNSTSANITVSAASRLLGRGSAGGAGDMEELSAGSGLSISGTELVNDLTSNPDTGWSVSNVSTDKVYNADSTDIDEIADVLGTLIDVLKAKGILGA
jgi:hypothetical protein